MAATSSSAVPTPDPGTQDTNPAPSLDPRTQAPAVDLVAGSRPEFSDEAYDLLAIRLKMASILLCCGFLAFLIRSLLFIGQFHTILDWSLLALHVGVTLVTGLVGIRLYQCCPRLLKHLRQAESMVFGLSAVFFCVLNYVQLDRMAQQGLLAPVIVPWLLLIFTYALYIPNSWQRALRLIAPMAVAPLVITVLALWTSPAVAHVISQSSRLHTPILEIAMVGTLAASIAVWGADRMHAMRVEVHEMQRLGQYRLRELLGVGGMGEVYLAEHLLLKRPCALKLIRPEKAGDPHLLARFEREVRSTARLTHWNTVEIFDYGRAADGTFYYVMEYLPGKTLDQLVTQYGPLPAERVISLLEQTCDALSEAHGLGLVHRDIKPANIIAAHQGGQYDVAKLLDFGLVRTNRAETAENVQLTQVGVVAGSPLFLSPEQALGDQLDERSDIYSLGAVAWFLLAGRAPFTGENVIKVILAHAHQPPEPPSRVNPTVPADLEAIVMRCLSKRPDERYQSAADLRRALLACRDAGRWTREAATAWWQAADRMTAMTPPQGLPLDQALAVTVG